MRGNSMDISDKGAKAQALIGGVLAAGLLPLLLYSFVNGGAVPEPPALRDTSLFEQWLVVIIAFGIKPVYMLLSLIGIILLRRQRSPDLVAMRWGLIAFWFGECACSINYMLAHANSDFWEYLHNFGMAVCFSFVTYAMLEGMDRRLIKLSSSKDRCSALSLCRTCIKHADVPCRLVRVFKLLIPATLVVAIMLPSTTLKSVAYDTNILGSLVHFAETPADQLFEIRYCPALAILLLTVSWLVLLFKREEPVPLSKVLFAAAMGPLGFGFMRLFLSAAYQDDLILYVVWEELTELVFAVGVLFILRVFRRALLAGEVATMQNKLGTAGET
jgi:hypothetical protein